MPTGSKSPGRAVGETGAAYETGLAHDAGVDFADRAKREPAPHSKASSFGFDLSASQVELLWILVARSRAIAISARTRAAKLGVVTSATDTKRCAECSRDPFSPDDILAGESWGLARIQGSPVLVRSPED